MIEFKLRLSRCGARGEATIFLGDEFVVFFAVRQQLRAAVLTHGQVGAAEILGYRPYRAVGVAV